MRLASKKISFMYILEKKKILFCYLICEFNLDFFLISLLFLHSYSFIIYYYLLMLIVFLYFLIKYSLSREILFYERKKICLERFEVKQIDDRFLNRSRRNNAPTTHHFTLFYYFLKHYNIEKKLLFDN